MSQSYSRIEVGTITGAHGIRGQVKLRSFVSPPRDIATLGALTDAGGKAFSIKLQGGTDKALIAAIEGITDRNAAELLKGTTLYAAADAVAQSPQAGLVGKRALTKDGKPYGTVQGIYNFGAGDIVEIEKPNGSTEMLPLNASFVEITEADYIIIHPPEYLEAK